jgi:ribosomal protein S18 acetylase RimI-like enzyme
MAGWVAVDGEVAIAGATSFLHGSECGIYAVGTAPPWRRRGIARRLVEHALADAARRGARTMTLQSTPMGQRLYESLGFEPVGRYEEWVPA